jgi:hypothetical protein
VENAWGSCGCTVPEKPTEPILPGKTAKMKVTYNAAAVAPISKDVSVKLAGVDAPKVVHITGEVLTPEAYEAYIKDGGKVITKQDQPQTPAQTPATTPVKNVPSNGKTPSISPAPVKN